MDKLKEKIIESNQTLASQISKLQAQVTRNENELEQTVKPELRDLQSKVEKKVDKIDFDEEIERLEKMIKDMKK